MQRLLQLTSAIMLFALVIINTNPAETRAEESPINWGNSGWDVGFWNLPNPHQYLLSPPSWEKFGQYGDRDVSISDVVPAGSFLVNNGLNAPAQGVQPDRFMAQYYKSVTLTEPAEVTFTTTSDDGVRLILQTNSGSQTVIDEWNDHSATEHTATVNLPSGFINIYLQYYENGYDSVIGLDISAKTNQVQGPGAQPDRLVVDVNNESLSGAVTTSNFVYMADTYIFEDQCAYNESGFVSDCPGRTVKSAEGAEYKIVVTQLPYENNVYTYEGPYVMGGAGTLDAPFCDAKGYDTPKVCLPIGNLNLKDFVKRPPLDNSFSVYIRMSHPELETVETATSFSVQLSEEPTSYMSDFDPMWNVQKWGAKITSHGNNSDGGQSFGIIATSASAGGRLVSPVIDVNDSKNYHISYHHLVDVVNQVTIREYDSNGNTLGYKWVGSSNASSAYPKGTFSQAMYDYSPSAGVDHIEVFIELRAYGVGSESSDSFYDFAMKEM